MERKKKSNRGAREGYWGVVEGFYGRPWTREQRHEVCDWMAGAGLDSYLYSPKDDPKHRLHWQVPYTAAEARDLAALIARCERRGVRFLYGLAPGFRAEYSRDEMERHLRRKVGQLLTLGCRHFALLFDDIPPEGSAENLRRYGTWAGAHVTWTHSVLTGLESGDRLARLLFCPTPYCGAMSGPVGRNEYLHEIGERLDPAIDIFWTGRDIVSEEITIPEIRELSTVLRRPPVLWDNLFANDYDLRRVHLGPYAGRDAALRAEVRGILVNPNCEYRANYAPLRSFARYVRARGAWNPRAAHRESLAEWLPFFAEQTGGCATLDELEFLTDCLHLPYRAGPGAESFLRDTAALLHAPPSRRAALRRKFQQAADLIVRWQLRVTELKDRDLSYTLYRFVWELKEEVDLLQRFLAWQEAPAKTRGPFRSLFHQPGTYRGGLAARLQRLLTQRPDGSFDLAPNP